MDRVVKVPVRHEWKALYFAALREAIFLYDYGDKKQVENVLVRKGKTWHEQVSFNYNLQVESIITGECESVSRSARKNQIKIEL
jgi:hypothetical protein